MRKIYIFTLLTFISFNIFGQAPTNGLVAYYPFNGNPYDESPSHLNNGIANGAILTTDRFGVTDRAYSFNGTNNYIEVPDNNVLDLTTELTLTIWVKQKSFNARGMRLIDKLTAGVNNGYLLDVFTTNIRFCGSSAACLGGNTTIDLNVWTHYSVTFNNGMQKLFKNGILISSGNYPSTLSVNSHTLIFGWGHGGGMVDEWFNGSLDDIRIYNRALTDTEVQAIYTEESNPNLMDVTISNLSETINQTQYTVPREATIHYYLLAKKTSNPAIPVKNAVLKYTIGTDPTIRTSLPSDDDGLIDLNITVGGADPNIPTDDWIPKTGTLSLDTFYPVTFNGIAIGLITGTNAFTQFDVKVINKAEPIDKEIGLGYGFQVGAPVFSAGAKKKITVGAFKLNAGASGALKLGATADRYIKIKPNLQNSNIWNVYFNSGIGTSLGLEGKVNFGFGTKNIKIGANISLDTEIENAIRFEKGYTFNLTNNTDLYKLAYIVYSTQSFNPVAKKIATVFENLYNTFSTTPISDNVISSRREFAYGADYNFNSEVDAKVMIRAELLNLPGYGGIPQAEVNAKLQSNGGFMDNMIFETIQGVGKKTTNSLDVDFSANASIQGMINLTKGNRKNNPNIKTQQFEFFNNSFEKNITVSRTLDWGGVPIASYFSLSSKSDESILNPATPDKKYNVIINNKFNYGPQATQRIFSNISSNPSLQINSMASFIGMNNNSLVGSAWSTVGVSGSLYQQAYDLNDWVCSSSTIYTPILDIDLASTREISLLRKEDKTITIPGLDIDVASLYFSTWKTYHHELQRAKFAKSINRTLLTVDYPNITDNLEIPLTDPLEDFKIAINNALTNIGLTALNTAKGFITEILTVIDQQTDIILTNLGFSRVNLAGQKLYDPKSTISTLTANTPSVFTFTIPKLAFNTNTNIHFDYYYPENEINAITATDTFRVISDVFTLNATLNGTAINSTPNQNYTIQTIFSQNDLALASLPSNLVPVVLFLPNGSTVWQQIGTANSTFSFSQMGIFGLGVKISNDETPPTINVNYPATYVVPNYIDVTLNDTQSGIDWAKTTFASNNTPIQINRIGITNTFRVNISDIPSNTNGIYTFYISTIDLAGNPKTYTNVYPCNAELIIQTLTLDPDNPILKKALNKITSATITPINKDVIFRAGDFIELKPGFETKGRTFKAEIGGCTN